MTKTTIVETPAPAKEAAPTIAPLLHEVLAPDGSTATTIEGDRATVVAWMDANKLGKGERYLVQTNRIWSYKPRAGPRVKLTPEQKAAAKAERAKTREIKKAEVAARKAKKAEERAAKKAERERIKAEKAAGTYKVVATKGGAKISVKQPTGSTAQLQALARARQKVAEAKAKTATVVKK